MDRSNWDKIVSGAGAVVAVVLIALGAMAIYGGNFGRQNVRDRLQPQNISFPPADAMTPQEKAEVGDVRRPEGRDRGSGRGVLALHRWTPPGRQRREDLLGDERSRAAGRPRPDRSRRTCRRRPTRSSRAKRCGRSC